jgi:uncharacterized membrane protein (UPF0182 family)
MRGNWKLIFTAFFVVLILWVSVTAIDLYTEWLFFNELNYTSVFTKVLSTQVTTGLVFGFFSLVFLLANIIIANKTNFPPIDLLFVEQTTISLNVELLNRLVKPLTIISGIVIGVLGGIWGSSLWEKVLLFQNYADTGVSDPIFNRDIGFYLFKLPLFESMKGFAGFLIIIALLVVSINYFLRGQKTYRYPCRIIHSEHSYRLLPQTVWSPAFTTRCDLWS